MYLLCVLEYVYAQVQLSLHGTRSSLNQLYFARVNNSFIIPVSDIRFIPDTNVCKGYRMLRPKYKLFVSREKVYWRVL